MSDSILSIQNVTKRYAGKTAVNLITLDIPEGIIFGLLGPNGAGKTSLIRMITGITAPDSGTVLFRGKPLESAHLKEIGYMPEERGLYKKMKVGDHLVYLMRLRGISKSRAIELTHEWLTRLQAIEWINKQVGELSKGMQQKIQFIATVAHNPPLLILDEPFSGLDPINSKVIQDEIDRMKNAGTTIIFSTHRMEQVEEICDRIGLISQGQLVLEDDVKQARRKYYKNQWAVFFEGSSRALENAPGLRIVNLEKGRALIEPEDGKTAADLLAFLAGSGMEILKAEAHMPRLSEIFIEVVEKQRGLAHA